MVAYTKRKGHEDNVIYLFWDIPEVVIVWSQPCEAIFILFLQISAQYPTVSTVYINFWLESLVQVEKRLYLSRTL